MKHIQTSAIGIMSGTSLDGLDMAYCRFRFDGEWHFEMLSTRCVEYGQSWKQRLGTAHLLTGGQLHGINMEFGHFIGEQVKMFMAENEIGGADMVCSHGHTVLHSPKAGYTVQIGSGAAICATSGMDTVSDFRVLDVALGGQGAPLVPIGDELLFSEYAACLNLGGFSNVSFRRAEERIAFDICPVNIALNRFAMQLGRPYDENGEMARAGSVNGQLLRSLNSMPIYEDTARPSFAREWFEHSFLPLLKESGLKAEDMLRTLTEHAAIRTAQALNLSVGSGTVLVTGGGAKNGFLMERIGTLSNAGIAVPNGQTIDFKEAMVFAFLGVLRWHGMINVIRSTTGAKKDSCSGTVHLAKSGQH